MDLGNQSEPDSRFVQANERTLLAWIRTGLALVTFGFVVARLGAWLEALPIEATRRMRSWPASALGFCFVALALVVNTFALFRYRRVLEALRAGKPIPMDRLPSLLGWAVVVLSAMVVIYILAELL